MESILELTISAVLFVYPPKGYGAPKYMYTTIYENLDTRINTFGHVSMNIRHWPMANGPMGMSVKLEYIYTCIFVIHALESTSQ